MTVFLVLGLAVHIDGVCGFDEFGIGDHGGQGKRSLFKGLSEGWRDSANAESAS